MNQINAAAANLPVHVLPLERIPKLQRWLLLWINSMMPLLVITAIASGSLSSIQALDAFVVVVLVETLAIVFTFFVFSLGSRDVRMAHLVSLCVHAVVTFYGVRVIDSHAGVWILFTLYVFGLLFRHHHFYQSNSVTGANRVALGIDTLGIFLVAMYYYWWAIPMGGALERSVAPFFATMLVLSVILRVYSLWFLERIETQTHRVSSRNVWLLLVAVLVLVIVAQHWIVKGLLAVFGGVALLLTPVTYLLPHLQPTARHKKIPSTSASEVQKQVGQHVVHTNHMTAVYVVLYIILAILLVLALYFLFRRTKAVPSASKNETASTPTVIRHAIGKRSLFLETGNPIRLRAQAWIREELKHRKIERTQTWRQMIDSGAPPTQVEEASSVSSAMVPFIEQYEMQRYGEPEGRPVPTSNLTEGTLVQGEIPSDE